MLPGSGERTELVSREWKPPSFIQVRSLTAVRRYLNIFYSTWGLLLAGLVFALPMMHMRIEDYTTDVVEDEASSSTRHSEVWDD